jgi:hypothetical protein
MSTTNLQRNGLLSMPLRRKLTIACQTVALACASLCVLRGHPPAKAQAAEFANAVANAHRDDAISGVQKDVVSNTASLAKLWLALNEERAQRDAAEDSLKEQIKKDELEAAAKSNTGNGINITMIVSILASIGLQVRGPNRRKGAEDKEA